MTDIIDRPPTGTSPPKLPVPVEKKRGTGIAILPCLNCFDTHEIVPDFGSGYLTMIYRSMVKVDMATADVLDHAHTESTKYRDWLHNYTTADGLPPHINYAGCLNPEDAANAMAYMNWKQFALKEYC